ncbi:hypothetical protein HNP03_002710 [Pseudomonas rhodesiae]|jgi:hypothetical protein|nr:hypothetical protein [Pseudomonas rhodesiae]
MFMRLTSAAENPFPERLQLRNWLMIGLLLDTGIRRGELLKFYTTDINKLMGTLGANSSIDGLLICSSVLAGASYGTISGLYVPLL